MGSLIGECLFFLVVNLGQCYWDNLLLSTPTRVLRRSSSWTFIGRTIGPTYFAVNAFRDDFTIFLQVQLTFWAHLCL